MRRLYHIPISPFCRKIRLVLEEKSLEYELVVEKVWERRVNFLKLNPASTVPVLIDEDGTSVADSMAIVEYLEDKYPEIPMLPGSPAERAEARRLVAWIDGKFHNEVTVNLVYERVHRRLSGGGGPNSVAIRAGLDNIKMHLDYIAHLADRRRWLAGDKLTVADLATAAHLSCLDYIDVVPWERAPGAKEWYAKIKSRPAFRSLLADHVPGMPPPASYADLDF